jgi:hypothetical protein
MDARGETCCWETQGGIKDVWCHRVAYCDDRTADNMVRCEDKSNSSTWCVGVQSRFTKIQRKVET